MSYWTLVSLLTHLLLVLAVWSFRRRDRERIPDVRRARLICWSLIGSFACVAVSLGCIAIPRFRELTDVQQMWAGTSVLSAISVSILLAWQLSRLNAIHHQTGRSEG